MSYVYFSCLGEKATKPQRRKFGLAWLFSYEDEENDSSDTEKQEQNPHGYTFWENYQKCPSPRMLGRSPPSKKKRGPKRKSFKELKKTQQNEVTNSALSFLRETANECGMTVNELGLFLLQRNAFSSPVVFSKLLNSL